MTPIQSSNGGKKASAGVRPLTYAATSTYSTRLAGGGTGRPSSRKPSRWNAIASRISASTSPTVSPVATHPGMSGT